MEHRVVKSVPIPNYAGGQGRAYKYPFRDMAVGACIELFDEKSLAAARNAAWREKRRNPEFNYTAIALPENSNEVESDERGKPIEGGRRVYGRLWRTEV